MANIRNDSRLRAEMEKDGIDILLAFSMENVFYLSGALFSLQDNIRERLSAAGFAADGRDFLLCASNEASAVEAACHTARLETYVEFERAPIAALAEILEAAGFGATRIGIEKRYLMAAFYEELAALLPRARLIAGDRALEAARAIKVPEHIRLIADASQATERAVAQGFAAVRPGMTERALAAAIIQAMFDAGAQVVRHAVVTVGDNARHAHPFPSAAKRLDPGDVIRVDVGGLFQGYGSDIARMAVVGPPNPAQTALYDKVRGCVHSVGRALRPGMRAADAYEAAVAYYAAAGIPAYRRDHVGHSLSILGGHDNPMLHAQNPQLLEAGMVIALEPILRDPEGRRITVEDTFAIGASDSTLLTTATDTTTMAVIC
jgi:Xaa-Pro aminopeptidase